MPLLRNRLGDPARASEKIRTEDRECWGCGEVGHILPNCPNLEPEPEPESPAKVKAAVTTKKTKDFKRHIHGQEVSCY